MKQQQAASAMRTTIVFDQETLRALEQAKNMLNERTNSKAVVRIIMGYVVLQEEMQRLKNELLFQTNRAEHARSIMESLTKGQKAMINYLETFI